MPSASPPGWEEIEGLARRHPEWFGADESLAEPSAALLGSGESYAAWLVRRAAAADGRGLAAPARVVVRVPRHPVEELPRPMAEEFAALRAAPPGIGPEPIRLEQSVEELGLPYQVSGYLPGRVLTAPEWSDELLGAHARQLARLHAARHTGHGDVTAEPAQRAETMSMVAEGQGAWQWWADARPDVTGDRRVQALAGSVARFLAAVEPDFARLETFALVHGDACVPNVLVHDGLPRYVDWEWSAIGDPARDLAFIGGEVWAHPWYLPLRPELVTRFVRGYAAASGAEDQLDQLERRRRAWLVHESFFASLHFRRLLADGVRVQPDYAGAVEQLTDGLERLLR